MAARRAWAVMLGMAMAATTAGAVAKVGPADIRCRLTLVPASAPATVRLRLTLENRSARAVDLLTWGTPFEGWMQPFVRVTRDGAELPYLGPAVKRGDPDAGEYLRLAPGRPRTRTFMLAPAFDVTGPGRYQIDPRLMLHDVHASANATGPARPRDRHEPLTLDCPSLEFTRR